MIEVSEQTIDRLHTILAGVENADKKVLKPALTRGLMAGKTEFGKQIRKTYEITPSVFSEYAKVGYKNVSVAGDKIIGSIKYAGGVIPLYKFSVAPKLQTYGKKDRAVSVSVKKNTGKTVFDNAFIATMKSDHVGIFERKGTWRRSTRSTEENNNTGNNEKIKELFGPSVPSMAGEKDIMQAVEDRINEVINQRIDHEIDRLLSNSGG